jgi:enoyl-CoA hydratase/carnithine racemase
MVTISAVFQESATMSEAVLAERQGQLGIITLNRPKALNSLSLEMVRSLMAILRAWYGDVEVVAVLLKSSSERALCAGGDIRFLYQAGSSTPQHDSALLEDFFSEEYALNHLIHHYPKPYIALMDGVVMGGGMGISQAGPGSRCRIVTERTKMAMPEVNIGLFPDVGGSYFLSRTPGLIGRYMGLSGETIGPHDALYAGLADFFVPSSALPDLQAQVLDRDANTVPHIVARFCAQFHDAAAIGNSQLARQRGLIDRHFAHDQVCEIVASLQSDTDPFARQTLLAMQKRSPLMMCVTLEQLKRGANKSVADCLRMERNMVRRNFEHGEVLEGVRALVIDKDNAPVWSPPTLAQVSPAMVERFFTPVWPEYAHPLRNLA